MSENDACHFFVLSFVFLCGKQTLEPQYKLDYQMGYEIEVHDQQSTNRNF